MALVYAYDEMEQKNLPLDILEDMRHFGYGRYDSFEGFDCISLEMLDYENLLLSKGSVLFYLEKERWLCFTSRKEEIENLFHELEGKYPQERLLYGFFAELTKGDEAAFDTIEKEIMELEQVLIGTGKGDCVSEIISLRKRLMVLKKYYEQLLNVLDILIQNENGLFEQGMLLSFRMLYRRTERRFQNVLNLRESVTQVRESYEAEVDISLNKTMKLFTVVTTIFLPLTLIAGWYGMNFDMPEYAWEHGYLFVSTISVLFIVAGILFFRRKKWF
ncbi:MAG: CorA family divalent cation transporter [Bacillota bacterium]|nr:CorA family divalent cation transporter [Bacillota bacterium]